MKYLVLASLLFCSTAFAGPGKKDADVPNLTESTSRRGVCTIVIRRENSTFVVPASSIKYLTTTDKAPTYLTFLLHGYTNTEIVIRYKTVAEVKAEMERYNRILQECTSMNV